MLCVCTRLLLTVSLKVNNRIYREMALELQRLTEGKSLLSSVITVESVSNTCIW